MIDTHSHIDAKAFDDDRDAMIQRAWDAGIEYIIVPAISPDRFDRVRRLAAAEPRIFNGAGVHPHHAHEATDADMAQVETWCADPKTVAVGEIGLDYHYDFCPPDVQQRVFREQLRIAKRTGKPVIVHNRESDDDLLRIIDEEQDGTLRGVLHCFSSGIDVLQRALDLGMCVSFTGNITFKKSTLDDVVRAVPEGRYMIETDAPYITPVPFRGQRNEPSHVRLVAEKLAEIRSMTLAEIITSTSATARRLFGLTMLAIIMSATAMAQPARPVEDDYETEDAYDRAWETYELDSIAWAKFIKPRTLGVGVTIGFNTVVERQQFTQEFFRKTYPPNPLPNRWVTYGDSGATRPISYDGLFAFGGTMMYTLTDHFTIEGTYTYTRNEEPARRFGIDPVITNVFEFAGLYTLNPYSKINFMLTGGVSVATSDDGKEFKTRFGPNAGIALGMAIPTSFGVIYPLIDIRFNFMLGVDKNRVVQRYDPVIDDDPRFINEDGLIFNPNDPTQTSVHRANVSTLYSIPRVTIMWYPAF